MPGKLQVVVGGQFGSEAKGAVAGYLAQHEPELLAVRVAGPNAGHTVYGGGRTEYKLQQVPVAAVSNLRAKLGIAAGSEIEHAILDREIETLDEAGYGVSDRLLVDRSATIIEDRHQDIEVELRRKIGSTGKGVGAARAERVMRSAELFGGDHDVAAESNRWPNAGGTVQVEGTQGYGLGLHGAFYPQCTSSDCRAIDFLSMAGINPWTATQLEIWVVLRTFPIRVAGNSGPLTNEIQWGDLGVEPEYTTVTKKQRRVGEFDVVLARAALVANGWPSRRVRIALSFLDYLVPEVADQTGELVLEDKRVRETVYEFEDALEHPISLIGTGPDSYTRWEA